MKKSVTVGLTGTSGSGKTTVCGILRENGCMIINSDKIAREVTQKGSSCLVELQNEFGAEIICADGTLNRRKLGEIAFSSRELTDKLNAVTHPYILKRIESMISKYKSCGAEIIILDAPQLFEAKADKYCDCIAAVIADKSTAQSRIVKRDNIDEKSAENRLSRAHDEHYFTERADYIINNNAGLEALKESTLCLLCKIRRDFNI